MIRVFNTLAGAKQKINITGAATCNFVKKETLAQVFSCEFCEISKNTFSTENLWTTASDTSQKYFNTFILRT